MSGGTQRAGSASLPIAVPDATGAPVGYVWFTFDGERAHMARSDFVNSFKEPLSTGEALRLLHAASEQDWAAVDAFHPEALPWFCRKCARNYNQQSWRIFAKFDDDAWLDSYRGVCPRGHERMIAD